MWTKFVRFVSVVAFCHCLWAQYRSGIQGTVTDVNGGIVADASIQLTSQETNIARSVKTNAAGVFVISALAPGKYILTVEKQGFSKEILNDVQVGAEQMQGLSVHLQVGTVSQAVTVSDSVTSLVDTESAMIAGTITEKELQNLPSFGRDPFQLVRLAPGVFGDGALSSGGGSQGIPGSNIGGAGATDSIFKTENGVQISANGGRQNSNDIQIDGVGVNSTSWGGAAVITPNESSVKEVKIIANSYDAENGRTSGAQILVVSQNGTNELHGNAFFKFHRPGLDAFQRWNGPGTPSPVQKDTNRFNQFGGSLGGPILKNKLFAFFSYETLRNNSVQNATGWYETPQFEQGAATGGSIASRLLGLKGEAPSFTKAIQISCAQAGLASSQCQNTASGLDLGSPLKSALGTADPTYGQSATPFGIGAGFDGVPDVQFLQTVSPNVNTSVQYNGRLDYQITERDLATFTIYWVPVTTHSYNGPARAANSWNHTSINQSWALLWNHTFSPSLLNEARFNKAGWDWNEITDNPQEPWGLPPDNIDSMGTVAVQNFGAPGPSVFNQKTYAVKDTLTKVQGSHNIKFGADISWARFLDEAPWSARPSYNFRNLWDFANDAPYTESANFSPLTGQPTADTKNLRFNIAAFFVQDDWKVKPGLTVNLGLRWEDFTPLTEAHGNISNIILGQGPYALSGLTVEKGQPLSNNNLSNFGPQIGFAWNPNFRGRKSLVLRGGFGIGYNLEQLAITSNGRGNPPFLTSLNLFGANVLYAVPGNINSFNGYPSNPAAIQSFGPNGLPTSGAPVSLTGFPVNMHTTATYRYSLDAQYEFGHNWMASVGFQGSQTRHYTIQNNLSLLYYSQSNPMVQSLDWYSNDANSHYNALLTEVQHRFSGTFEIDFQYRYSKSIDEGSQDYYQDNYPWNLKYSVGPSDFDVTHNFKLWGLWTPKLFKGSNGFFEKVVGGWNISGIVTAHSGFPWSPQYCNTSGNVLYENSGQSCLYPAAYTGGTGTDYSNSTFQNASNFPKGSLSYFTLPSFPLGSYPSTPGVQRNSFRGPGYFGNDFTLSKAFGLPKIGPLGENARFIFEANFYNLFNKLNLSPLGGGSLNISNDGLTSNSQFGLAQNALAGRIVEFQVKFNF